MDRHQQPVDIRRISLGRATGPARGEEEEGQEQMLDPKCTINPGLVQSRRAAALEGLAAQLRNKGGGGGEVVYSYGHAHQKYADPLFQQQQRQHQQQQHLSHTDQHRPRLSSTENIVSILTNKNYSNSIGIVDNYRIRSETADTGQLLADITAKSIPALSPVPSSMFMRNASQLGTGDNGSVESSGISQLEEPAHAGMLDSQSVISAVTFGTVAS